MSVARELDVAVVGAGPAGAAAALAAARAGCSVVLFEARREPGDKPCGEGILPGGVDALRALGLDELVARGEPLERIRYVLAGGHELDVSLPRAGLALERPELERALYAAVAAEPGIELVREHAAAERRAQGFELCTPTRVVGARTLVAADGLGGGAAAWLCHPRLPARRHGLRARARSARPLERVEVHLGGGSEVYLTPLPGGRVNVAVLRDGAPPRGRPARTLLAEALAEHPRAAEPLGEWLGEPELRALPRPRARAPARAGAFLAGDAAGGIDPVLGCGVALALSSGLAAGRAAASVVSAGSGAPEREFARLVRRETAVRRRVAAGLLFLAAHPRLQLGFARTLGAWPALARALAAAVAGGSARAGP